MVSRGVAQIAPIMLLVVALCSGTVAACSVLGSNESGAAPPSGIHKIQHVVIIMQENRSFDNYFGTYPGADGIPMKNGVPTACVPDFLVSSHKCVRPYHNSYDLNVGGPHGIGDIQPTINGGKMDGFLKRLPLGNRASLFYPPAPKGVCNDYLHPSCYGGLPPDLMGYHDSRDIPNYWAYARSFVLQDHMFEPVGGIQPPVSPLYGLGLVGGVLKGQRSGQLQERTE
jgi:phospholipase C